MCPLCIRERPHSVWSISRVCFCTFFPALFPASSVLGKLQTNQQSPAPYCTNPGFPAFKGLSMLLYLSALPFSLSSYSQDTFQSPFQMIPLPWGLLWVANIISTIMTVIWNTASVLGVYRMKPFELGSSLFQMSFLKSLCVLVVFQGTLGPNSWVSSKWKG